MTKKDLNHWIMYHEINKLSRLGFSIKRIAPYLVLDTRTVRKHLSMSEQDYELYLVSFRQRHKVLSAYEEFVKQKLIEYQDTSTAQVHDWLKEHHPGFPAVSARTVYNFVMYIRQVHNLPFIKLAREYFPVEELPYGEQSQVDFGEYNMRSFDGKRKKVHFFAMVLSRSRMKSIWFLDKPFTAQTVCQAHEKAFAFFGGIPVTIVYDQDKTMLVDENIGDLLLTSTFKQFTKSRGFALHFCRKADPESKGKIENVIQYVKKNFLYNRPYSDLETLNDEAIAWLGRTANYLPHNFTKKSPYTEHIVEIKYLKPYAPLALENIEYKTYYVRKVNNISYKSNFYSLPSGTYLGVGTQVLVKEKDNIIEVYSLQKNLICTHVVSPLKGQNIINTNHRRDTSKSLGEMIGQTSDCFTNKDLALSYVQQIRKLYPRYTRDHLQVMLKAMCGAQQVAKDKALGFCLENMLFNGNEFEQVLHVHLLETPDIFHQDNIRPLNNGNLDKACQSPQVSNIQDYENIVNQSINRYDKI